MLHQKPNITKETREALKEAIFQRSYPKNVKNYLMELPLFEEEAVQILKFLKNNPSASEEYAIAEVENTVRMVTKKYGMTAMERDRLYRIG